MKVGYFSAYYRGLECLLDMWPKIKAECPKATLDVYYGWGSWDALEGANGVELKKSITEKLKQPGVTEHGRVSHTELAKVMKKTDVWCYGTEFPEVFCITAIKTLAAGCYPVTTGVAALKETQGGFGTTISTKNLYSNEYSQKKFIDATVKALKNPISKEDKDKQRDWVFDNYSWEAIAKQWQELFN